MEKNADDFHLRSFPKRLKKVGDLSRVMYESQSKTILSLMEFFRRMSSYLERKNNVIHNTRGNAVCIEVTEDTEVTRPVDLAHKKNLL